MLVNLSQLGLIITDGQQRQSRVRWSSKKRLPRQLPDPLRFHRRTHTWASWGSTGGVHTTAEGVRSSFSGGGVLLPVEALGGGVMERSKNVIQPRGRLLHPSQAEEGQLLHRTLLTTCFDSLAT